VGIRNAQAEVDTVNREITAAAAVIAQKTFLNEYPYSVNRVQNLGDGQGNFSMNITTGFMDNARQKRILFFPYRTFELFVARERIQQFNFL
jgi:hypothetical protein